MPVNSNEKVMVELKLAIAVNTFAVMEQNSPIQGVRPTIPTELISSLPLSHGVHYYIQKLVNMH